MIQNNISPQISVISHLSLDIFGDSLFLGGPASYCGRILNELKANFKVFVMTDKNFIFKEYYNKKIIHYHMIESKKPTIFSIINSKGKRKIRIISRADNFKIGLIPKEALNSKFILLSPIVNDMPISFIKKLHKTSKAVICIDPFNNDDSKFTYSERKFFSEVVKYAKIIKMSKNELLGLFKVKTINQGISKLKKYDNLFIITLGSQGTLIFENKKMNKIIPSIKFNPIIDSTGCGDIFFAGFLYGLNKSYSIEDSTLFGNICASLSIRKRGVDSVPSNEKIEKIFFNFKNQKVLLVSPRLKNRGLSEDFGMFKK